MKIEVCDICYKTEKKLVETNRYISVKGKPYLKMFFCNACEGKVPKNMIEYVKFVFKLDSIELTDEQAREHARRH